MLESARNCIGSHISSHADVSKLVRDARRFSIRVPVVGKISVPPPRQLAFYGVLGVLAATQVLDWPIVVALGVGHALSVRNGADAADAGVPAEPADEPAIATAGRPTASATRAPERRAPAKKAVAGTSKQTPAKRAAAKNTPAKKTAAKTGASKAPAKKAPAKRPAGTKAHPTEA